MKKLTPILIAATALGLCGCATDNDTGKVKAGDTSRDQQQEMSRDMVNQEHSATSMGSNYGKAGMPGPASQYNPYH
jgi:Flp pilus assembly protein TadD